MTLHGSPLSALDATRREGRPGRAEAKCRGECPVCARPGMYEDIVCNKRKIHFHIQIPLRVSVPLNFQ